MNSAREAQAASNSSRIQLGELTTIGYLPDFGEDLWAITPAAGTTTAIISRSDFESARVAPVGLIGVVTESAPEVECPGLVTLLRNVFGPAAYVEVRPWQNPETGADETLVEAHYGFAVDAEVDKVVALHELFMQRFSREVPLAERQCYTLVTVPTDAD